MRKLVCTIMILFTCFSGSVVLATTVYPAVGGQWNYGVGITGSYSDYMHGQKIHTATIYICTIELISKNFNFKKINTMNNRQEIERVSRSCRFYF